MSGGGAGGRKVVGFFLVVLSFGRGHSLYDNTFGSVVALYAKTSRKQVRSRQLSCVDFIRSISDIAVFISFKEPCNLIYKITFEMYLYNYFYVHLV